MVRIQNGDHQAFSILVHRHTDKFFGTAYRLCQHVQEAEDIVQEAFIKLWQAPDKYDSNRGAKFTTWFYRVVSNLALDTLRKRKPAKGSEVLDRLVEQGDSQEQSLQNLEEQELLEQAIEALPERQKLALNLCVYDGLSQKDAAEVMEINVKALESLLSRAKSGLRDTLTRQGIIKEQEREGYG